MPSTFASSWVAWVTASTPKETGHDTSVSREAPSLGTSGSTRARRPSCLWEDTGCRLSQTIRSPSRYRSLDFWRGVACLLVVVFHSTFYVSTAELDEQVKHLQVDDLASLAVWATSRFWLGVPLFFVISGYCIAASASAMARTDYSTTRYFQRRFRRIYPPLWIFLIVSCAAVGVVEWIRPGAMSAGDHAIPAPWSLSRWNYLGSVTLTETWRGHLTGQASRAGLPFGHMWTLCYGEQFYAVVGVLLFVDRRRVFAGAACVTAAVALMGLFLPTEALDGFFFDELWLQFAAGMAVFVALTRLHTQGRAALAAALLVACAWQFRDLTAVTAFHETPAQGYMAAFGFAALLLVLHRYDDHIHGAALARPTIWCGQMCYSLYLVHWPVVKLASHAAYALGVRSAGATLILTVPVCIALSAGIAWVFHRLVERQFLNTPVA